MITFDQAIKAKKLIQQGYYQEGTGNPTTGIFCQNTTEENKEEPTKIILKGTLYTNDPTLIDQTKKYYLINEEKVFVYNHTQEEQNTDNILRLGDKIYITKNYEKLFQNGITTEDEGEIKDIPNTDFIGIDFKKRGETLHSLNSILTTPTGYYVPITHIIKKCHKPTQEPKITGISPLNTTNITYTTSEQENKTIYELNTPRHPTLILLEQHIKTTIELDLYENQFILSKLNNLLTIISPMTQIEKEPIQEWATQLNNTITQTNDINNLSFIKQYTKLIEVII